MRRSLITILILTATGCNSAKSVLGSDPGTSMLATWNITGNLSPQSASGTYQVTLVSSPCTVTTPVGTFSVQGPVCFTANNNSTQGAISGTGLSTSAANTGEGVLIGVTANPVPANGAFNLLFVLGDKNGSLIEFTGTGTVSKGTLTGAGSCSPSTTLCQGVTATYSGNAQ